MIAFVMSGGGNRGALQVGALQVLLEAGIVPDLVVGTSVGAINGAFVAHDPTVQGTQQLARIWARVTRDDLYPGNRLTALWSMVRGKEGLFSNANWERFLSQHLPCDTTGELTGAHCYIAATDLQSGKLHVFGEDKNDPLLDALMATCALPPLHPPYWIDGRAYIDGGTTANLPLRIALEKGATQIYALNISRELTPGKARNFLAVSSHAVGALLKRQIDLDLEHCASHENVWMRQIDLIYNKEVEPWDFSRTEELIALGREAAQLALSQGLRPPTWQERLVEGAEGFLTSLATVTTNLGTLFWSKPPLNQTVPVRSASTSAKQNTDS
ncbi:MAG: patatin-like phospholipase family protein [Chloroflexota bacterium]|nr:patatin-like phospholipase family protein [Chloroflexota bacterium]